MLHTRFALLLAVFIGFVCACSRECPRSASAVQAASSPRAWRIAVIPKGTSHEFWKAVEIGARRADAELGDIEIVWKGPCGEGATQQQIALVESITSGGYDGLCLAPLDGRALAPAVRAAIGRNIPVVIFDSALTVADVPVTAFVATPNRRGGEEAGAELARAMNDEGNVIVLRYQMGSASTQEREDGCLAALAAHPRIHVISDDVFAGPEEADAVDVAESVLSTFGERVDGVFCPNESSTSGFLTALQRDPRPREHKLVVVGFDLSKRILQALQSGALHATVAQDPATMGYQAVMALHARLTGQTVQPRIETPQTLVLRESLSSPEVKRLLEPFSTPR
jgi:ribose transport system substrate-binding protein